MGSATYLDGMLMYVANTHNNASTQMRLQMRHIERLEPLLTQQDGGKGYIDAVGHMDTSKLDNAAQVDEGHFRWGMHEQPMHIPSTNARTMLRLQMPQLHLRCANVLREKDCEQVQLGLRQSTHQVMLCRLRAQRVLTMRDAFGGALVHLLGLNDAVLHHNVRQIGEEQDALVEARAEQRALELLQYGDANEERIRTVAQHQFVPQVEDLV